MAEEVSHMLHEEPTKKREQISMVCIDELVPKNHLLRKIDRVIDWSFIYDLVKENKRSKVPIEVRQQLFNLYVEANNIIVNGGGA